MARISNESVREKTGRVWEDWFTLLDNEGADALDHAAIARMLQERHGVSGWWAQSLTVEYEKARGRRVDHQRCEGDFSISVSKTFGLPAERLFEVLADDTERMRLLPEVELRLRKAAAPKSLRFEWSDDTRVNVYISQKEATKSQLSLEHEKLADADAAERMKAFWKEQLTALKDGLQA